MKEIGTNLLACLPIFDVLITYAVSTKCLQRMVTPCPQGTSQFIVRRRQIKGSMKQEQTRISVNTLSSRLSAILYVLKMAIAMVIMLWLVT